MNPKKVLGTILVLIVIVYAVSGLKNLAKNGGANTENSDGQAQVEVDYSKITNQVVYNNQNIDIKVVELGGEYYFPLLDLGNKLNLKIDINDAGKMSISDGINSTVIKTDVTVFVNGEEHNKAKNFQPVNNYLVPQDFVKIVMGIEFDYKLDLDKNIKYFYMTGPDIYEINQNDVKAPHLYVYTNEGLRDLGLISSKSDAELEYELTKIESVVRTEKSDIITTNYKIKGVENSNNPNVLYVRDGILVDNSNLKTSSFVAGENLSEAPTKSYDKRVAFLSIDEEGSTVIRIYDDATGTLLSERDTINQYGGQVLNIQAVGQDFIVAGMYGPLYDDSYNSYYTAVINLNTNEVIPVYEKFGQAEKLKSLGKEENILPNINNKAVPFDGIVFNFVADDGSLKFSAASYDPAVEISPETVNITLVK